jgi:hydrogenase maturation protease
MSMITVIGCGNPARSDDGVGVWVAQQLLAEYREDTQVRVLDAGTSGIEVMFKARGSAALIIIDAATSGAEPGQIFEVPGAELENPTPQRAGAHGFRWDHALYAGRKMFGEAFPEQVAVFLIEAADVSLGLELSDSVATAANLLLARVRERIESYRPAQVRLAGGDLFFDHVLYQRHLQGTASVALVRNAQQVIIFPLHAVEHGGLLLKQRNSRGDRIVHAQAFFRDNALNDSAALPLDAVWDARRSALVVNLEPLAT